MDRRAFDEWVSSIARVIGLLAFIVFSALWALDARFEPTLVAMSGALYGIGELSHGVAQLRRPPPVGNGSPGSDPDGKP